MDNSADMAKAREVVLENPEAELFARHKKKTERTMKIVVALLIFAFAFTLWFLLTND